MKQKFKLADIAKLIKGELKGDGNIMIEGIESLELAKKNDLSFYYKKKYEKQLENSKASAFLVLKDVAQNVKNAVIVKEPRTAAANVIDILYPPKPFKAFLAKTASIDKTAKVSKKCQIHSNAVIGKNVTIKDNVTIHANTVIGDYTTIDKNTSIMTNVYIGEKCKIGKNVVIMHNSVVSFEGFSFIKHNNTQRKVRHVRAVHIEDDVEIGSLTTIEAGTFTNTILGRGSKIGSHCHIAHNCKIGEDNIIFSYSAIAGSVKTGLNMKLGPNSNIIESINVADNCTIGAKSDLIKDTKKGDDLLGSPAIDKSKYMRLYLSTLKFTDTNIKLKKLAAEVAVLKSLFQT